MKILRDSFLTGLVVLILFVFLIFLTTTNIGAIIIIISLILLGITAIGGLLIASL